MTDLTTFAIAPAFAARAGLLTELLRPFAQQPHVFVADGEAATTVQIHKSRTLDVELVIQTGELRWTANMRDQQQGRLLASKATSYADRSKGEARAAMLADLQRFLRDAVAAPAHQLTFFQ
jgi:hypothetical protein